MFAGRRRLSACLWFLPALGNPSAGAPARPKRSLTRLWSSWWPGAVSPHLSIIWAWRGTGRLTVARRRKHRPLDPRHRPGSPSSRGDLALDVFMLMTFRIAGGSTRFGGIRAPCVNAHRASKLRDRRARSSARTQKRPVLSLPCPKRPTRPPCNNQPSKRWATCSTPVCAFEGERKQDSSGTGGLLGRETTFESVV